MRSLFSNDKGECFPMSQYISRVLRSSCLRFVVTWFFQVRRLSKRSPRYLTVSAWGTTVWLMYTGGQCPRRRVNVMCNDLVSFIFSLHIRVQFSIVRRWPWSLAEAKVGSGWVVKMEECAWIGKRHNLKRRSNTSWKNGRIPRKSQSECSVPQRECKSGSPEYTDGVLPIIMQVK
jgi:hypothetical protein